MENCSNLILCAVQYSAHFFEISFAVIAAASAVAALTPTPADDHFLGRAYRFIDMLALNLGHAKDQAGSTKGGRFVAD